MQSHLQGVHVGETEEHAESRPILPFVRLSYAQPSRYSWVDEEGHRRPSPKQKVVSKAIL